MCFESTLLARELRARVSRFYFLSLTLFYLSHISPHATCLAIACAIAVPLASLDSRLSNIELDY